MCQQALAAQGLLQRLGKGRIALRVGVHLVGPQAGIAQDGPQRLAISGTFSSWASSWYSG